MGMREEAQNVSAQPWWIFSKDSTDAGNQSYNFCQKDKPPLTQILIA